MRVTDSDKSWEFYGKTDPYYGVLTADEYRRDNLTDEQKEQFFESGHSHIDSVLAVIREYLQPHFAPESALDFGCGVGRLVIPLATLCRRAVGVDISASMLREAQKNCDARSADNVELVLSDDDLSRVKGKFDFVHSYIVLQHIPVVRGEKIIGQLIDHLNDGGIGALQFTYHRKSSATRRMIYWARTHVPAANAAVNLLRKKPIGDPVMEMNEYDLNRLFVILQETGCHHTYVRFSDHPSPNTNTYGVFLFFQKRSLPTF